jgi:hypothetical protein
MTGWDQDKDGRPNEPGSTATSPVDPALLVKLLGELKPKTA